MSHPRMYEEGDPWLAELRGICLGFPEAAEVEAWGRPTFRAGKKIFAVFAGTEERPYGVIFKPDDEERQALLQDPRFYSPPYWGPGGWLALDVEAAPVDVEELAELIEVSYRLVALKRMIAQLDGA